MQAILLDTSDAHTRGCAQPQFTCFTSTKVQILTPATPDTIRQLSKPSAGFIPDLGSHIWDPSTQRSHIWDPSVACAPQHSLPPTTIAAKPAPAPENPSAWGLLLQAAGQVAAAHALGASAASCAHLAAPPQSVTPPPLPARGQPLAQAAARVACSEGGVSRSEGGVSRSALAASAMHQGEESAGHPDAACAAAATWQAACNRSPPESAGRPDAAGKNSKAEQEQRSMQVLTLRCFNGAEVQILTPIEQEQEKHLEYVRAAARFSSSIAAKAETEQAREEREREREREGKERWERDRERKRRRERERERLFCILLLGPSRKANTNLCWPAH
jgi:hypothetical protein